MNILTRHLVLGLPLPFSHVGGDNPLSLFSESGVGTELKGKKKKIKL